MTEENTPPAPHHGNDAPASIPEGAAIGALGITLIGGAVAAAISLLIAVPLLRRKPKPAAKPTPQARRPRRKRTDA